MPTAPATACRHCGTALTPLQQRQGGLCGAAACRYRETQARWRRLTVTVGQAALDAAATLRPAPTRPALLWLRAGETRLVPLSAQRREAHRAHLQALIDGPADESVQPLAPAAPASTLGAQEWRLCAQCRGRCCTQGGPAHAFMTLPQLLRWQKAHAGRTLQDAVDAYMSCLPARHVRHACVYQGAQGCVLPREERADICNSYACDPLLQVQAELKDDPQAAFVAVTMEGDVVVRRGLIQADGTRDLG